MKNFKDLGIIITHKHFTGDKIKISRIVNREIVVHDFKIEDSTAFEASKCLHLQISINETMYVVFTSSKFLREAMEKINRDDFPIKATIVKIDDRFEFR